MALETGLGDRIFQTGVVKREDFGWDMEGFKHCFKFQLCYEKKCKRHVSPLIS